jgi:hypothetical protein
MKHLRIDGAALDAIIELLVSKFNELIKSAPMDR